MHDFNCVPESRDGDGGNWVIKSPNFMLRGEIINTVSAHWLYPHLLVDKTKGDFK